MSAQRTDKAVAEAAHTYNQTYRKLRSELRKQGIRSLKGKRARAAVARAARAEQGRAGT